MLWGPESLWVFFQCSFSYKIPLLLSERNEGADIKDLGLAFFFFLQKLKEFGDAFDIALGRGETEKYTFF
jgi:hypothetical protein